MAYGIQPGVNGSLLTQMMFVSMIEQWKDGRGGKATLKQTADAFGISVPNLRGILKTGTIGTNSRRKIADAWSKMDTSPKPFGGSQPEPAAPKTPFKVREYKETEITLDVWRGMIKHALGHDIPAGTASVSADRLADIDMFFQTGRENSNALLKGLYYLTSFETHNISRNWNEWLAKKKGFKPVKPAPLEFVTSNDVSPLKLRAIIQARLGFDPAEKNTGNHLDAIKVGLEVDAHDAIAMIQKNKYDPYVAVPVAREWNRYIATEYRDRLKKTYRPGEVTPEVFGGMIKKIFHEVVRFDQSMPTQQKNNIAVVFNISYQMLDEFLRLYKIESAVRKLVADVWNTTDGGKSPPTGERFSVSLLNDHAAGSKSLTKKDYDSIEKWGRENLRQNKYRQSVFRGIKMDGHEAEIIKIMDNKPIKLSTLEGANRAAESWTTDPGIAKFFAASHGPNRMYVIMEARPAPKDIVIHMDDRMANYLERREDIDKDVKSEIVHYIKERKEREVIVRTGNRKYTLCRNIVFLSIPKKHLIAEMSKAHKINVLIPIVKRIKDQRNLDRFQRDLQDSYQNSYKFACGSGNFVYLASDRMAETWMRKLASR